MKDETKAKIKAVFDEVKVPVIVGGTFFCGWLLGGKYTKDCIARGMCKFHNAGTFKFFNPETGLEISTGEAVKVIKNLREKGMI